MTKLTAKRSDLPKPGSDAITGLETVAKGTRRILGALNKRGYVGIVMIDLAPFARIEREYGAKAYNLFLRRFAEIARQIPGSVMRREDQLLINDKYGEQLIIFLGEKRDPGALKQEDMEVVCDRIYSHLIGPTMTLSRQYFSQLVQPDVGYSFVIRNPVLEPHRIIQRLLQEARDIAKSQRYRFVVKNRERLKEVIVSERIETVFQPIIALQNGKVLGYEALSRGPVDSIWRDPGVMFSLAIETDLGFELDRLCRKLALRRAAALPTNQRVFINTLPVSLHDPEFRGKYLRDFLAQVSLAPKNIVLEVTETMAVEEYETLQKSLRYYRGMGFAVAIDDAGTGYANLEMIMHLKPEFIKVDLSLIRDIGKSMLKRELVRALMAIGDKMYAHLIAEGIEKTSELHTLQKLGIKYGQGFLFGRPGSPFPIPKIVKMQQTSKKTKQKKTK